MKCSKHQAHSMDGVIVGHSPTSLVYNPRNKQYYEPDSYRINSYRLPCSIYRDLKYNGGIICSLYCDESLPSRNYILLVLDSNGLTLLLTCFWPVLTWTFRFLTFLPLPTPPLLLLRTHSSITVLPLPSLFEIWHPSYLNLQLTLIPSTLKTLFSLRSFG